jgi:hypothetical protein
MRNPAVLIGTAMILIGLGFAAGMLVGQRRAAEDGTRPPFPPSAPTAPRPLSGTSAVSPVTDGSAANSTAELLAKRVVDLEAELRAIREETPRKPAPVTDGEVERQAFEDLLAMESGKDRNPDQLRTLIHHLAALEERSARYFVAMFRSSRARTGVEKEQKLALQLTLLSGGPDAAELIQELLSDPAPDDSIRKELISQLSPKGGQFFSVRRVPVGADLASSALGLTRSTDATERMAGVHLLGGVRSDTSRDELVRLLNDRDSDVRVAAARSLGLVGDSSARKVLEACVAQSEDSNLQEAAASALKDFDQVPR